jgi:hypothetical protein
VAWYSNDHSKLESLITKCYVIADEMYNAKMKLDPSYTGTPDDGRIEDEFEPLFGKVHIGPGEKSSTDKVTNNEIIRWRTTLFDIDAAIQRETKEERKVRVQTSKSLKAESPSSSSTTTATNKKARKG